MLPARNNTQGSSAFTQVSVQLVSTSTVFAHFLFPPPGVRSCGNDNLGKLPGLSKSTDLICGVISDKSPLHLEGRHSLSPAASGADLQSSPQACACLCRDALRWRCRDDCPMVTCGELSLRVLVLINFFLIFKKQKCTHGKKKPNLK